MTELRRCLTPCLAPCLTFCLLLAAIAVPLVALGAGDQTTPAAPVAKPSEQPQASAQTAGPADETPQTEANTPPANAATPRPIKEFIPTEKIQADSAVSFPIDI